MKQSVLRQWVGGSLVGVAALSLMAITSCTDTARSRFTALGKPHEITVYQRDEIIYHGWSTGKVQQDEHSIAFEDKESHELVEISLGMSATVITKVKADD